MLLIYGNVLLLQLLFQPLSRHAVSHEEILGIFIVNKIAHGVLVGVLSALLHRRAVIIRVFDYLHASASQQILFPLLCVRRHVNNHMESQPGAHDSNAHPQISGAAHLNRILSKEIAEFLACQDAVVIRLFELS